MLINSNLCVLMPVNNRFSKKRSIKNNHKMVCGNEIVALFFILQI
jgi:hypothetical protein